MYAFGKGEYEAEWSSGRSSEAVNEAVNEPVIEYDWQKTKQKMKKVCVALKIEAKNWSALFAYFCLRFRDCIWLIKNKMK